MTSLLIGANGGLAQAIYQKLNLLSECTQVDLVSRSFCTPFRRQDRVFTLDSCDADAVESFCFAREQEALKYQQVFCCIGMLHQPGRFPEKQLQQVRPESLSEYFQINTLAPANWLARLTRLCSSKGPLTIVFFSARVGSIEDNQLGGWYGYRISKAALNMLVKSAAPELIRFNPQARILCYHPGTVDTSLSAPFQSRMGTKPLLTPSQSVDGLFRYLTMPHEQTGAKFIDWQGKSIPW